MTLITKILRGVNLNSYIFPILILLTLFPMDYFNSKEIKSRNKDYKSVANLPINSFQKMI